MPPDQSEVPAVQFPGGLPPPDRASRSSHGEDNWRDWIYDVWEAFVQHGATEMEEEGPVIYVNSHYLHHFRHPDDVGARPLRFDQDWTSWEEDVRGVWEDLVDGSSIHIIIVQPDPPVTIYQSTVATVLVVQ